MPDVHVVPSGDRWVCEIGGKNRSTHTTQEEAISTDVTSLRSRAASSSSTARVDRSARRTRTGTIPATFRAKTRTLSPPHRRAVRSSSVS